jgi:hypothetical protein
VTDDLNFSKTCLKQLTKFAQQLVDNHKAQGIAGTVLRKNRTSTLPWLRFYLALVDPQVMPLFLIRHTPNSREQMEADMRSPEAGIQDCKVALMNVINDVHWVPKMEALPDLHKDFVVSFSVLLTVEPVSSPEEVKQHFTQARFGPLVLMINAWECSGNGNAML